MRRIGRKAKSRIFQIMKQPKDKETTMKYAIACVNPTIGDWSGQLNLIRSAIKTAKEGQAELLVLPELTIGVPNARDLYLHPQTALFAEQSLAELAPLTKGLTLVCGAPFMHEGMLYNAAAVFHDGVLMAIVPKRYMPGDIHEDRWFAHWDYSKQSEPHLGAMIGEWNGQIEGLESLRIYAGDIECWPEPPKKSLCIEVNNRVFAINRFRDELTRRLNLSAALEATLIRANVLGTPDGTTIYDGGGYILENGHINALSRRFGFEDVMVTFSDDQPEKAFDPTLAHLKKAGSCPNNEDDYTFAELEAALCLGLHDYMKRAHISKLALALSGGRDSAMVAVIAARLMAMQYPDETPEQLKTRMKDFLYTAYLPSSSSSSAGTQKAALALAEHFGFDCPVIPIGEIAAQTVQTIEESVGRKLTWEHDDLTLQNVQARTRSSVIWTLANAHDALLLTTGNMSEASVGYCTMDGDSSGSLDPVGNIPKTLLSSWLEWARNFHDIPALDLVFAQPPSAELRPVETKQADEVDLMPYRVIDSFVEWFIVQKRSPKEVFNLAKQHLTQYYQHDDDIKRDLKKFVTMSTRAQWKRVRAANSFKVMPYDLDPGGDLQWPCLQDAFTKALSEL